MANYDYSPNINGTAPS